MVQLVNVTIANKLDSSTRNKVLVYHVNDTDADTYLTELIKLYINLDDFSDEYILSVDKITPTNVSVATEHSVNITKLFK